MRIYVGNLSYETTESSLAAAFAPHGAVTSAEVMKDRESGATRGFGFVEMADRTEAENAISALNGTQLQGRELNVSEARARNESAGRGPARRGPGGGRPRF